MDKIVRKHYIFEGDVQGVGFRYRAKYGAQHLGVTGWVENEPDGTVEMEAQGTIQQLYELLKLINGGKWIVIENIRQRTVPVEEHEYTFQVRGY